jgi:hypothetical protein
MMKIWISLLVIVRMMPTANARDAQSVLEAESATYFNCIGNDLLKGGDELGTCGSCFGDKLFDSDNFYNARNLSCAELLDLNCQIYQDCSSECSTDQKCAASFKAVVIATWISSSEGKHCPAECPKSSGSAVTDGSKSTNGSTSASYRAYVGIPVAISALLALSGGLTI